MGNCASGGVDSRTKDLDRELREARERAKATIKILLLGAGNSGKSTVMKQFQLMQAEGGLSGSGGEEFVTMVRERCVHDMRILHISVSELGNENSEGEGRNIVMPPLTEAGVAASKYFEENNWNLTNAFNAGKDNAGVCAQLKALWTEEAIQVCWANEALIPMLEGPVSYWMDQLDLLYSDDWKPSTENILMARSRTVGIAEQHFIDKSNGAPFVVLDVGGQRNERKKWISHFEGVDAILFLVSIAEYDKALLEDASTNRLVEALDLFGDICTSPFFEKTYFILFLNKCDLFKIKIAKGKVDLDKAFGKEYLKHLKEKGVKKGQPNVEIAEEFVKNKFLKQYQDKRESVGMPSETSGTGLGVAIKCFFTCATDTEMMPKVLTAAKSAISNQNLQSMGL